MTPAKKTLMGIGGFLPIIGSIVLMGWYVTFIMHLMQAGTIQQQDPNVVFPQFFGVFKVMIGIGIPLAIISMTMMVLYIIHAVNNKTLSDGERIVWIILFVITGAIAFPIYFFMRIAGKKNDGREVSYSEAAARNY